MQRINVTKINCGAIPKSYCFHNTACISLDGKNTCKNFLSVNNDYSKVSCNKNWCKHRETQNDPCLDCDFCERIKEFVKKHL